MFTLCGYIRFLDFVAPRALVYLTIIQESLSSVHDNAILPRCEIALANLR